MSRLDTEAAVNAFLARGGVVKRVARTKRTMTHGVMEQAIRGSNTHVTPTEERAILRQHAYLNKQYDGKR